MLGLWEQARGACESVLSSLEHFKLAPLYARNYADRVLHDRQFCVYLAEVLLELKYDGRNGFNGPDEDAVVCPASWPDGVRMILLERDRGRCALCGLKFESEHADDLHIGHIVSLEHGGCNDVINLQLLCGGCKSKKDAEEVDVPEAVLPGT